jgi:hypothetical protein
VVKSCDQVLLINVKQTNLADTCNRTAAFMTMSIYMVNLFDSKDPNKLLDSITFDKLSSQPQHLIGSPGCVTFQSQHVQFGVCLNSKDEAEEIIQAYEDFMRCRMGDNLKRLTFKDIRKCVITANGGNLTEYRNATLVKIYTLICLLIFVIK